MTSMNLQIKYLNEGNKQPFLSKFELHPVGGDTTHLMHSRRKNYL